MASYILLRDVIANGSQTYLAGTIVWDGVAPTPVSTPYTYIPGFVGNPTTACSADAGTTGVQGAPAATEFGGGVVYPAQGVTSGTNPRIAR